MRITSRLGACFLGIAVTLAPSFLPAPVSAAPAATESAAANRAKPPAPAAPALDAKPGDAGTADESDSSRLLRALKDLRTAASAKQAEIREAERERDAATYEGAIAAANAQLEMLHQEARALDERFARMATQADASLFREQPKTAFDPKEKLLGLMRPILEEIEDVTAASREISRLDDALALQLRRRDEAQRAIANVERLLEESPKSIDSDVRKAVTSQMATWQRRLTEAEGQIASLEYEILDRRSSQEPFLDIAGGFVQRFLRVRGLHLLLAVLAFAFVAIGLGRLRSVVSSLRGANRQRHFADRLTDLLVRAGTLVAAIAAMLFVFNVTGDWFLLGIALTFLIGLGWIAIKAVPQFSKQITLVLNMGAVREGECVTFDGVLWQVTSLGFTVVLENDRLEGGQQSLPVRMLAEMHSRPLGPNEELFPSRCGDWVRLEDGAFGCVDSQTAVAVRLKLLGGGTKTYPTSAYLALAPVNLSAGFRCTFLFGIDYRHQAEATTTIPEKMEQNLRADVTKLLAADELVAARVIFRAAGSSSLDYVIKIDVKGSAAGRFSAIEETAQRSLVESCNAFGWVIPFPQVTVHRADASG